MTCRRRRFLEPRRSVSRSSASRSSASRADSADYTSVPAADRLGDPACPSRLRRRCFAHFIRSDTRACKFCLERFHVARLSSAGRTLHPLSPTQERESRSLFRSAAPRPMDATDVFRQGLGSVAPRQTPTFSPRKPLVPQLPSQTRSHPLHDQSESDGPPHRIAHTLTACCRCRQVRLFH